MTGPVRHQTFVGTVIQSAPRIRSLIANMRPTWHLDSLSSLTPDFVRRHAITGLIWDIDGTLTPNRGLLAEQVSAAFGALRAMPELGHVVLSNADEQRFCELASLFPSIPILRGYREDEVTYFRCLRGIDEAWTGGRRALGPGAIALRKPNVELVHEAVRVLGGTASGTVMVGDQYLTDIAGANMGGIRSIKLPTFARATFPFPVRTAQRLEAVLHRLLHGRPTHITS